jgi:CheY-like chemotaxis protein
MAIDGNEVIAKHTELRPRLILMDVSMPGRNGYEATALIRETEKAKGRHTPIIGVTAHALKGDAERCIAAGMDDYVPKPVSPGMLTSRIRKWLEAETLRASA